MKGNTLEIIRKKLGCELEVPNFRVLGQKSFSLCAYLFLFLFIDFREKEREEKNIDLLFHLFMHSWLILVCALIGDQTHNLGVYQDDSLTNGASQTGPVPIFFCQTILYTVTRVYCSNIQI